MFGFGQNGAEKTRRMMDATGAYDGAAVGVMTGLVAGTQVAGTLGWRSVETLSAGDEVLTFDNGLMRVVSVKRTMLWTGEADCPLRYWPLEVPKGAIGNKAPMRLLANQAVIVESDIAEAVLGDPFALIPARALEGICGIARTPAREPVEVITLYFEDEQVVFSSFGALFHCPCQHDIVVDLFEAPKPSAYTKLSLGQARKLAELIELEYAGAPVEQADIEELIAA